jgi:hypothetical protein
MPTLRCVEHLAAIAFAASGLLAAACYRPLSPHHALTQRAGGAEEIYRDPAFAREDLDGGSVVAIAPRLAWSQETYGPAVLRGLTEAVHESLPSAALISPGAFASRVNEVGLTAEYGKLLETYDRTGILEREGLRLLSAAVGARYFAVPMLVTLREGESGRLNFFSFRLLKTSWANARVELQIWDGSTGRELWAASSDVTIAHEQLRENPVRLADAIRASWDRLLDQLPERADAPAGPYQGT